MLEHSCLRKVLAALGVVAIVALGAYTYSTIKQTQSLHTATTISVSGKGEIFAKPDIATFTFTVEAKENDASATQSKAADGVNAILAYLKEQGIEDKDIKTDNYSLTPRYEYPPQGVCTQWGCPPVGEPKLTGYQVDQTVSVKVRNTSKAGEIISGVGTKGATNVSGLTFTIDDEEALKAQARDKAIADAKAKAETLAKSLGVKLDRMSGYNESQNAPYPMYDRMSVSSYGVADSAGKVAAPEVPTGENTIRVDVTLTYDLK